MQQTDLEVLAGAEASGWATVEDLDRLRADPDEWAQALRRLLTSTEGGMASVDASDEGGRVQILADFGAELDRLADSLCRLTGEDRRPAVLAKQAREAELEQRAELAGRTGLAGGAGPAGPSKARTAGADRPSAGAGPSHQDGGSPLSTVPTLQGSWAAGRIVVWAGSPGGGAAPAGVLQELIAGLDAATIAWKQAARVSLPDGSSAPARSAPVEEILGWLVGVAGATTAGDHPAGSHPGGARPPTAAGADPGRQEAPTVAGDSLAWLSEVARWATELVAQGRMVPSLRRAGTIRGATKASTERYRVKWQPALVDARRLHRMAQAAPGAVTAVERTISPEALCRSMLGIVVDAICRAGAARLVTPATAGVARTRSEVAEALLSGLDGTPFVAVSDQGGPVAERMNDWAASVTGESPFGLEISLDAPERDGGWLLAVGVTGIERRALPVERALTAVPRAQMRQVEGLVQRAERLVPALLRPSTRRGQVILSGGEAAELLFGGAGVLVAAGFDVRLPAFSRRRTKPRLRLSADGFGRPSEVGVRQLSRVRWSVLFGDTEVDAKEIARLAAEARPLVQVNGRWVQVDKADLAAASSALRERSGQTEMSGAAIVRQAVGLGGGALGGPVDVAGSGWAVDIVRATTVNPPGPVAAPPGFGGELRGYQADAAGWLAFLDGSGLGGCLAMDMGLGKTPTVLAHILANRTDGPSLVICPPAVLGNWAREAARFTPALRVETHHGANRAGAGCVASVAARADIVLTTYSTAMRDADALAAVDWHRVVVDEAQAIKNPASDTAQALRRIPARRRLAMTGTPVENGLGDLWAILDFTNPGLVGPRNDFIEQLSRTTDGEAAGEKALRALNGLLVYRRTKVEPAIAAELSGKVDILDHCTMTPEQVGLYQAIVDRLLDGPLADEESNARRAHVLAAITALKQVCDHPAAYLRDDSGPLAGRSGKLERLEEIVRNVFTAGERILVFTHFARWGEKLAAYLSERLGQPVACYHGGLARGLRDRLVSEFQEGRGAGALVLSLKAGGAGLNLTAASHVVLYDRWWNPAVEDQARDRAWRIGQTRTVMSHRLVCPGTVDERVEEVVAGKRHIADLVLPARSSLGDIDRDQLRAALGLTDEVMVADEPGGEGETAEEAA
ncbi:MAG: DEAD/DEAH box helicase [Acidimicrobiales bacterium]